MVKFRLQSLRSFSCRAVESEFRAVPRNRTNTDIALHNGSYNLWQRTVILRKVEVVRTPHPQNSESEHPKRQTLDVVILRISQ